MLLSAFLLKRPAKKPIRKKSDGGLARGESHAILHPSTTRKRDDEPILDNPENSPCHGRKGRGEKTKPWGKPTDHTVIRGHKSPIRQEKGRDASKPVVRLAQERTIRRNPVLQRMGGRQCRKPTAGIVERTVGRNKPREQKCQRGTNVRHMSPQRLGTQTRAKSLRPHTKRKDSP